MVEEERLKYLLRNDGRFYSNELFSGLELVVPDEKNVDFARWASELISDSGSMLPKTEEEMLGMFLERNSIILTDRIGTPVAHSAITFVYRDAGTLELGGVIVDKKFRRMGYGLVATFAVIEYSKIRYPGWTRIALCNESSLPIFLSLGAEIADLDKLELIPPEAWEACITCPKYDMSKLNGKMCCDTPVLMP